MADIDLKMLLSLKDNASKSLDKFNNRLDKTQKKIKDSNSGFGKLAGGLSKVLGPLGKIGAIFGGIGVGLFAATKASLNYADAIGKAAAVSGVTAETLQELQYAFSIFGITEKQTEEGLRRFTRRLGEFVNSGAGPAKVAIEKLGLVIKDSEGKFIGTETVLDQVITKFAEMETQAERSAYAAQLFGDDAGPKIALALGQGSRAIDDLRIKARSLGLVISNELIAQSEQLNDEWNTSSKVIQTQLVSSLVRLAPAMLNVAKALDKLIPQIAFLIEKAFDVPIEKKSIESLKVIRGELEEEIGRITKLLEPKVGFGAGAANFVDSYGEFLFGGTTKNKAELKEAEDTLNKVKSIIAEREKIQADADAAASTRLAGGTAESFVSPVAAKSASDLAGELESLRKELDPIYERTQQYSKSVQTLDDAFGKGLISGELYDELMVQLHKSISDAESEFDGFADAMKEGARLTEELLNPTEILDKEIRRIEDFGVEIKCNLITATHVPLGHEVIVHSQGDGGRLFRAVIETKRLNEQRTGWRFNAVGRELPSGEKISLAPETLVEVARRVTE